MKILRSRMLTLPHRMITRRTHEEVRQQMQRWSSDPGLLHSDNLAVLITENLADVHRRVVASTQLAAVSVPLPTDAERLEFIQAADLSGIEMEMEAEALAKVTAGLTLVQIRGLFRRAAG